MARPAWPRSLRLRLQIWHALILAAVVAGFGGSLAWQMRRAMLDEIDAELLSAAQSLEGVLRTLPPPVLEHELDGAGPLRPRRPGSGPPPGRGPGGRGRGRPPQGGPYEPRPLDRDRGEPRPGRPGPHDDRPPPPPGPGPPPGPPGELLDRALVLPPAIADRYREPDRQPFFAIRRADGSLWRSQNLPPGGPHRGGTTEQPAPPPATRATDRAADGPAENHPAPGAPGWPISGGRGPIRDVRLAGPAGTEIQVGRSIERELVGLHGRQWRLALTGGLVLALGLSGGWCLSSGVTAPLRQITDRMARVTASNLAERVQVDELDQELRPLAGILNTMLERLDSSFRQQTQFTADASHELRTPLAVIVSHVELALAKERTSAEYRETLGTCAKAAGRMHTLIDDLLVLARADSGSLALRPRQVDLHQVAEETRELLAPLAASRAVTVEVQGTAASCSADPDRLAQIVANLVENAIAYNRPEGRVTLTASTTESGASLTVSDTGVGIATEDLPRVFDRFYRADRSRSRVSGGNGLGLAICRTLVEAHRGTLTASSQAGQGSTFTLWLPASATSGQIVS